MFCSNKLFLESLFIFALLLFPITHAVSGNVPHEVNQLQARLMEANEKISMLSSDQQKTAMTVSTLQTSLNTARQEISDLQVKHNQLDGTSLVIQRTANGHGR